MINLHNCETWFMLYADGELSAAERIVVEQFLEAHPGLRSAFDQLQALKFLPDDAVVFPDRFLLKQQEPAAETEEESMSVENQYRFEPDLSVSFPNKHLLYRAESPVRGLEQAQGTKVVDNGAPVRWFMSRTRHWAGIGGRYAAAALTVSAIGLLWFFFSKDSTNMPLKPIAATTAYRPEKITEENSEKIVEDTPHKTTGMVLEKTPKDNSKDNPKVNPKINSDFTTGAILAKSLENESLVAGSDQSPNDADEVTSAKAVPEKKQRNDRVLNKTTGITRPGRVDTEATTSLAQTMPRSNLSPATRALAAERIAAQESIAASRSSVTNTALSSTALSSAVLPNARDHSSAMDETKAERPRTGLRRLLDKINATIDQELEYEEDKKYIQVASFKIPLSKEDKK